MKIMFNVLDRPFELSNLRYRCEAREVLCFAKHHSLTPIYIYIGRSYGALLRPKKSHKTKVKLQI
jgi:hypothetical protein